MECWIPGVSATIVATDRRVRYGAGGVRRLRAERAFRVRRTGGGGRGWGIRMRIVDDGRNIRPGKRSVTRYSGSRHTCYPHERAVFSTKA